MNVVSQSKLIKVTNDETNLEGNLLMAQSVLASAISSVNTSSVGRLPPADLIEFIDVVFRGIFGTRTFIELVSSMSSYLQLVNKRGKELFLRSLSHNTLRTLSSTDLSVWADRQQIEIEKNRKAVAS